MAKASNNNYPSVLFVDQSSAPATPAAGHSRIFTKSDGVYVIDDDGNVVGPLAAAVGGYTQGARVYNNAAISISNNTETTLTFNSELYDTDTIHDTGSNTGRLTCKTAGKYVISCVLEFASNATGYRSVAFRLNGSTYIAGRSQAAVNGMGTQIELTTIYDLALNDYVEVRATQTSGGNLNVNSTNYYTPHFMMQRIG